MDNNMKNIKGRYWIFIIGFISALVTSRWSPTVAIQMIELLFCIGLGIAITERRQLKETDNIKNINNYHYKWKVKNDERPKGCCYDCRMKYSEFPDMIIPDNLWELINPTELEGAGILCPTCIASRLDYIGEWYGLKIVIN